MRLNRSSLLPAFIIVFCTSCFDKAPIYSVVPTIDFSDLCFRESADVDTLSLVLKFRDGDGDLGLSAANPSDNEIPFNEKFYFQKRTDGSLTKVAINTATNLLTYKDKRTNSLYATYPSFVTPYNCTNWEVIYNADKNPKPIDTVYCEYNPGHYNITIDFLTKNNDGSFTKYDWGKAFPYPNCVVSGYNGRFPVLSNDITKKSPLEGFLKYNIQSGFFNLIFSIKTLKLQVQVYDRALNKSNLLETPEFTLQSIKCN